jgi:hypothetical protein
MQRPTPRAKPLMAGPDRNDTDIVPTLFARRDTPAVRVPNDESWTEQPRSLQLSRMPVTVFDIKVIPGHRRERIETAVAAGGKHTEGPHEAWISPIRSKVGRSTINAAVFVIVVHDSFLAARASTFRCPLSLSATIAGPCIARTPAPAPTSILSGQIESVR